MGAGKQTSALGPTQRSGGAAARALALLLCAPWLAAASARADATGAEAGGTEARAAEPREAIAREQIALPAPRLDGEVSVEQALARRRSLRAFAPEPLPLAAVSQLLWAAQGITSPRGLRTAPSAGALYPLEVYLAVGAVSGVPPGVYRYVPRHHRLVAVSAGDVRAALAEAALDQRWVAEAPAAIVLAGVFERTQRKYAGRAPRYVHIEAGHAAQNVYLQAGALGLGTTMVGAFRDAAVARVIGLPQGARPLALLPVGKPR